MRASSFLLIASFATSFCVAAFAQAQLPAQDAATAASATSAVSQSPLAQLGVSQPAVTTAAPAAVNPRAASSPTVDSPAPETARVGRDLTREFWQINWGLRTMWIASDGYDVFSDNNALHHGSLSAGRTLLVRDRLSLSAGALWEFGKRASTARGADSKLNVNRFGAVLEGRYHLSPWAYAGAKLVPQAVLIHATLKDDSSPQDLEQSSWRMGADATAVASINVPSMLGAGVYVPGVWLSGEFGYGWTQDKELRLKPDVDDTDPRSRTSLDLGSLALRGPMMRLTLSFTF